MILLDEVEKAHKDVWNIFLQILDEGRITDGKGRVVNMKNTIIIMTSNIGSEEFNTEAQKIGFNVTSVEEEKILSDYSQSKEKVLKQLPEFFAPEFLNRIDKTIVFNPLDKKVLRSIVVLQLNNLSERMKEIGIEFSYDTKLISYIVSETYNPEYGARPVRR